MNKVFSDFGKLNWYDLAKGALVAVLFAVVTALMPILSAHTLPTGDDWKLIGTGAAAAFLSYVMKNLFSNSDGTVLKTEASANKKAHHAAVKKVR